MYQKSQCGNFVNQFFKICISWYFPYFWSLIRWATNCKLCRVLLNGTYYYQLINWNMIFLNVKEHVTYIKWNLVFTAFTMLPCAVSEFFKLNFAFVRCDIIEFDIIFSMDSFFSFPLKNLKCWNYEYKR